MSEHLASLLSPRASRRHNPKALVGAGLEEDEISVHAKEDTGQRFSPALDFFTAPSSASWLALLFVAFASLARGSCSNKDGTPFSAATIHNYVPWLPHSSARHSLALLLGGGKSQNRSIL